MTTLLNTDTPLILGERGSQILFVTPEITDFIKAGGLGEISAYLPRVLRAEGMDVRVLLPGYSAVMQHAGDMQIVAELPALAQIPTCRIGLVHAEDGLPIYLVICPELYERAGSPYVDESGQEFADTDLRFARLGLTAADIAAGLPSLGWQPDLVHAHDWPSALAPAYMAWRGVDRPSLMTVHNMAYQGVFGKDRLVPRHSGSDSLMTSG
jgi:starch synthase